MYYLCFIDNKEMVENGQQDDIEQDRTIVLSCYNEDSRELCGSSH